MQHPAEIAIHSFLRDAIDGKANMKEEVIEQVASDVSAALNKQFNSGPRSDFKVRMSNVGRPTCQLWFQKNHPNEAEPKPVSFMINMLIGDIVEAVFKGLLRSAKIDFQDNERVSLFKDSADQVDGEFDMILDDRVDDVKSASPWSYENKFESFDKLNSDDGFGYVAQLVGYATAAGKDVGGWWVVNKQNGEFKYVPAEMAQEDVMGKLLEMRETVRYINNDEPFKRCFDDVPETYRGKESGNRKLCKECGWCDYKKLCWPEMQELPSKVYKGGKTPPTVQYTYVAPDD